MRAVVESLRDVVWVHDHHGNIVYCSSAVSAVLGYAPRELQDMNERELIHPLDRAVRNAMLEQLVATEHLAGVRHEMVQQVELFGGEGHCDAAQLAGTGVRVKHDLATGPRFGHVEHVEELNLDPSGSYSSFRIEH